MKIQITDDRLTQESLVPNAGDAGIDMHACTIKPIRLVPGEDEVVLTGIKAAIPVGYVGLLIPRSSTGSKGLHLANATGVIDSSYRGEIMMKIVNRSNENIIIKPLDRIAQMVVVPHFEYQDSLMFVHELDETSRGEGGFGSTGK